MYIEQVYLIALIFICLFAGFKIGSILETRYWEAYIEFNKDSEIGMLKHIISHKDIRINELVTENHELHKYKRWYIQDNCEDDEGYKEEKGGKENGDGNEM